MRDRALYAIAECQHLAAMTEQPGRITRRFLTPPVHEVHAHLRRRMVALGMEVHVDAVGNLRGLWKPENSRARRLVRPNLFRWGPRYPARIENSRAPLRS